MAHEVETMAFAGQTPWHGLGTALAEADLYDWASASNKAGLDWGVELVPLVTHDTQAKVDSRAVRRSTDGKILGVVGPRYHPLQNRDAFGWFQPFLQAKEAALHTAGSLRGGSRVWVLAKLNRDPLVIAAGDEVEKFILLSHSHDGTLAVRIGFTPIRVVCANTLSMAHGSDASKLIRVKHTREVIENLSNIREIMDVANSEFEATAEQYRRLARKSINQTDLRNYVRRVLKIEDVQEPRTRTRNMMAEIVRLAETGRGNDLPSIRGTYWSAYNGVNEWLGYSRGNSPDNRLNSLWFGTARLEPPRLADRPRHGRVTHGLSALRGAPPRRVFSHQSPNETLYREGWSQKQLATQRGPIHAYHRQNPVRHPFRRRCGPLYHRRHFRRWHKRLRQLKPWPEGEGTTTMILKAPFRLPPDFLSSLGYKGGRRYVAVYWEPCGDEACYDDGVSSACGCCDNWLYLDFIRLPDVQRWRDENALHLGNSEERARHWLVVDDLTADVYAATFKEACRILRTQRIPKFNLPEG